MAHRIFWQVAVTGSQVVGKAFVEAFRQASSASVKASAAAAANNVGGVSLGEARKILGIENGEIDLAEAKKKYDFLFAANSKEKSGSFYLQSKVYRALERIKAEVGEEQYNATIKEIEAKENKEAEK